MRFIQPCTERVRRPSFWVLLACLVVGPVGQSIGSQQMHDSGASREQPWQNCTLCHGDDLQGGIGPGCTTCHNDFSEPDLPPTGHHTSGREDPVTNCTLCHGSDLKGEFGPSCFSCHDQLWEGGGGGGGNSPPTIALGGPYSGKVGAAVQFDATGTTDPDGDTLSYTWDFGDGTAVQGPSGAATANHTYESAGTYVLTLTVTDDVNDPVTATVDVSITADNGGGGGGGGGTPPPSGDVWTVQFPWLGTEGTLQFRQFGSIILVEEQINGATLFGLGFQFDSTLVWMDASGSLFMGSKTAGGESMWGIVFGLSGQSNTLWFAMLQQPPALDLGSVSGWLGGGLPDLGSLLGSGGTGFGTGGTTGGGSSGSTNPPSSGTGDTTSGTGGSTPSGSAGGTGGVPPTRRRAYDVRVQSADGYTPSLAPRRSR